MIRASRSHSHRRRARSARRVSVLGAWVGGLAVLLPMLPAMADSDRESRPVPPYENIYTEKRVGRFPYDIHAWVYPESSAARFQMPEEWADDGLIGTLALAYRVEWLTGVSCGHADEPACRQRVRCVLDAYFDQPSHLPFRNALEVNHDTLGGDGSAHWLTPQNADEHTAMHALRRSVTLDAPVRLAYQLHDGVIESLTINTFQYERRMYELDQVSFQVPCTFPGRLDDVVGPVVIVVGDSAADAQEVDMMARADAAERITEGAGADRDTETPNTTESPIINRTIRIPPGFHRRWKAHHDEYMAWEPGYHDTIADAPWLLAPVFEPTDYEARFGSAAAGVHDRDIHIWTYTKDFADRFGMPDEWIAEESLGDAKALAFRVERDVAGICGAGFDLKNCRRFERCMWDIYLPEDAPLPWYVDWPVSNSGGGANENSIRFLQEDNAERNRTTHELYYQMKYIYGGGPDDYRNVTAPIAWQQQMQNRKTFLGYGYWSEWRWWGGVNLSVRSHERRLDRLQILSLRGLCSARVNWEAVKNEETYRIKKRRLLFLPRPTNSLELDRRLIADRVGKPEALVEISISEEFRYRWMEHQTSVHRSSREIERALGVGTNVKR